MHRVLPPGTEDWYLTTYFLRAADNAFFKADDDSDTMAEQ